MGVSKNRGKTPPKWMVYNGSKPYEQMDDLVGSFYFWVDTHIGDTSIHGWNFPARGRDFITTESGRLEGFFSHHS